MNALIAIGISLLMHPTLHHRYWWMPYSKCEVGTLAKGNAFRVPVGVVCITVPGGWHNKPQPPYKV
jgi:hypothetical protein